MKKTSIITLILLLFTFFSCKKETTCPIEQEQSNCETTELGINEMSKFSFLDEWGVDENGNPIIDYGNSSRWYWSEVNDTIIITGATSYELFETQFFFKKNEDKCVDYLFTRSIMAYDNVIVGEPEFGIEDFYDFYFILQEYSPDDKIVGFVTPNGTSGIPIWVDFDLDNYLLDPYYYNE